MAAIPFLASIDMHQNELLQAVLQNLTVEPSASSAVPGQLYYNTSANENRPYYFDGTQWIDFYGGIEEITADNGLSFTTGSGTDTVVHLQINVDDSSIEIVGDALQIKDSGVITTKLANNNVTYGKIQQVGALKLLGNTGSGTANVFEVPIVTVLSQLDTDIPTSKAVYDAINSAITALGALVGDFDASSGDYPTTGSGAAGAIKKGDYWYISVAGTLAGGAVNVGDVLYANKDAAGTSSADWFVVESNRDQATETTMGIAKVATDALVTAGTNDTDFITPLKLANRLAALGGLFDSHKSEKVITGDGSTTSFALTHSLNTLYTTFRMIDVANKEQTMVYNVNTDADTITVTFNTAPASGINYYVTILG